MSVHKLTALTAALLLGTSGCDAAVPVQKATTVVPEVAAATPAAATTDVAPAPSSLTATDRATKCTLTVPVQFATVPMTDEPTKPPAPWGSAAMTWSGGCTGGKASGSGVARMLGKAGVQGSWYGDAADGQMTDGVIEDRSGFQICKTDGCATSGEIALDDQQTIVAKAAAAARAQSAAYKSAANAGSAKYYADRAAMIEAMLLGE